MIKDCRRRTRPETGGVTRTRDDRAARNRHVGADRAGAGGDAPRRRALSRRRWRGTCASSTSASRTRASSTPRPRAMQMSDEDLIAVLDAAGIEQTLITGFDEWSSVHETFIPNDIVAGLAERHPDRFVPFAGADVLSGHGGGARVRGAGARPRLPRAQRAAVHDRPAGRRPPLLPAVREVRRARRAGQHPQLGELDDRERQRPRAIRATSTWSPPTSPS